MRKLKLLPPVPSLTYWFMGFDTILIIFLFIFGGLNLISFYNEDKNGCKENSRHGFKNRRVLLI